MLTRSRTQVWRRVLEILHDALVGPTPADEEPQRDDDHIVGRYAYVTSPTWGRCKIFYEQSGEGDQNILFLHTAGSDGRQYHGVMNDERMLKKCRMTAVDLPAHGRSFPYEGYWPGKQSHTRHCGLVLTTVNRQAYQHRRYLCGLHRCFHQEGWAQEDDCLRRIYGRTDLLGGSRPQPRGGRYGYNPHAR